jgi:hypothetical protein
LTLTYEDLTEPERAVWDAIEAGTMVSLPLGGPAADASTEGSKWGEDRQIRAQVLFQLATGRTGRKEVRTRALRLTGARITDALDLRAESLACPFILRRCFCDEPVDLTEAQAPALCLADCHLPGLTAKHSEWRGDVVLTEINVNGELHLEGAHLGGDLDLSRATLINPKGSALLADALNVDGNVLCGGLTAQGDVDFDGARIEGFMEFAGATLENPDGIALRGEGLSTGRSLMCWLGFRAQGEVSLLRARVGGSLDFSDATLINPHGYALDADGITVAHNVGFREGFNAQGTVNLLGCNIGNQVDFAGATLSYPDGDALVLSQMHSHALIFRPSVVLNGRVDLIHARVGVLIDSEDVWPKQVALTGFVYDSLREKPKVEVPARLRWLENNEDGYTPQLYEQLATVYREAGRDEDARRVAIAKQRRRRTELNWPGRVWSALLLWTVGYGYRTWQAALWLLGLLLIGWIVFGAAYPNQMIPAKHPGEPLPHFQPLIYALDTLLPVVNLQQQENWIPRGVAQWWAWVSILAGWVLTTAVVAALTGLIKKD